MNSNLWIVRCWGLENVLKLRVVTVFPSKRNFVPKFSLCLSLKWYWWQDDNIWEFQRTFTIGIRLCFNCLTSWSIISTGSPTRFRFDFGLDSFPNGIMSDSSESYFLGFEYVKHGCVIRLFSNKAQVWRPLGLLCLKYYMVQCISGLTFQIFWMVSCLS